MNNPWQYNNASQMTPQFQNASHMSSASNNWGITPNSTNYSHCTPSVSNVGRAAVDGCAYGSMSGLVIPGSSGLGCVTGAAINTYKAMSTELSQAQNCIKKLNGGP